MSSVSDGRKHVRARGMEVLYIQPCRQQCKSKGSTVSTVGKPFQCGRTALRHGAAARRGREDALVDSDSTRVRLRGRRLARLAARTEVERGRRSTRSSKLWDSSSKRPDTAAGGNGRGATEAAAKSCKAVAVVVRRSLRARRQIERRGGCDRSGWGGSDHLRQGWHPAETCERTPPQQQDGRAERIPAEEWPGDKAPREQRPPHSDPGYAGGCERLPRDRCAKEK